MNLDIGDIMFFGAGPEEEVNKYLSAVRLKLGKDLNLIKNDEFKFVWITDFPLFIKEGKHLNSVHHPFTMPKDCLLYTSPSPRDGLLSRMPSSA